MRVRVSLSGLYTYPDVVAVCGEPQFTDDQRDTLLNPILLVEALSPSTEAYDRGRKFEHYKTMNSLREYLLLATDRVHGDLYTRQPDGRWLLTSVSRMEESLTLDCVDAHLLMADIYEKVEFPADAKIRAGCAELALTSRVRTPRPPDKCTGGTGLHTRRKPPRQQRMRRNSVRNRVMWLPEVSSTPDTVVVDFPCPSGSPRLLSIRAQRCCLQSQCCGSSTGCG